MYEHPEVLAFDMDGVVIDSQKSIISALNSVLAPLGFSTIDTMKTDLIGLPIVSMFKILTNNQLGPDEIASCIAKYRVVNNDIGPHESSIYKDIPLVLGELSNTYQLVIVTSKLQVSARSLLRAFDMDKYFVGIFGPESDGEIESKHVTLDRAHKHVSGTLSRSANFIALVGDRSTDIDAAHQFGILGIGARWGYGSPGELDKADLIFDSPKDLLKILRRKHR